MECFGLRVFKNAWFERFAHKEKISAEALWGAVERAEQGQIDADLGGGVIKQRIARPGGGKSKGYRSIVLYRKEDKAFFVFGFPKSELGNIREDVKKSSSRRWLSRYLHSPMSICNGSSKTVSLRRS